MTYSILGWDARTGQMGGAIQSHFLAVAPLSLWMEPGVGVVATQMMRDPNHGPRGLALLREAHPAAARETLLAGDDASAVRQIALLNATGDAAAFTGPACIPAAGHLARRGCSAQGVMLEDDTVWVRMVEAFERSHGSLAERLLASLEAGTSAGGDLRGQRAAALRVVAIAPTGDAAADRPIDLRVDDSPHAMRDLRRLYERQRAHDVANQAFDRGMAGGLDEGLETFAALDQRAGDDPDIAFRHALLLSMRGRAADARGRLDMCYSLGSGWRELVRRLPSVGLLPNDAALLDTLLTDAPNGRR